MIKSSSKEIGERGAQHSRSRLPLAIVIGCIAVVVLAVLTPRRTALRNEPNVTSLSSVTEQENVQLESSPAGHESPTAEEVVANKVNQFARDRLRILRAMAKRVGVELPEEADQFFNAVAAGRWDELNMLYRKLESLRDSRESNKLRSVWGPVLETLLIAECAHSWPAQKLLDYGQATLGVLAPGMIYVGGTDPGRGIPTLLNETSGAERHIVLTQNGLADASYLDYVRFLYGDQLALPNEQEVKQAFNDYITDAQQRFDHDHQFPNEPNQVLPGEDIRPLDNFGAAQETVPSPNVQVPGNLAVMAINERILQLIIDENPGMSFALEESFPLRSTYGSAMPLGPLMELRAPDVQNSFTLDTASDTLDYWRATADQLQTDSEAPEGSEVRKTYSHMAVAQANLLVEHNYTAEAEQAYRLAMEMEPSNPEAVYGLANLLGQTGRTDQAQQLIGDFALGHPNQQPPPESTIIMSTGDVTQ